MGDTDLTPEIVCKTIDQLKADYPEHAVEMAAQEESRKKKEDSGQKKLLALAQGMSDKLAAEIKAAMADAQQALLKDLETRLLATIEKAVAGSATMGPPETKLVASLVEATKLGHRGLETKVTQKKDEALKNWITDSMKRQAAEEKKPKDEM